MKSFRYGGKCSRASTQRCGLLPPRPVIALTIAVYSSRGVSNTWRKSSNTPMAPCVGSESCSRAPCLRSTSTHDPKEGRLRKFWTRFSRSTGNERRDLAVSSNKPCQRTTASRLAKAAACNERASPLAASSTGNIRARG